MTPSYSRQHFFSAILYALLLTFAFFLWHGYQFNSGDQIEHLLPVYQKLDHGLFRNDFYMHMYYKTFSVRYYYVQLVYTASLIFGVPAAVFIFNFICIFAAVTGLMIIARYIFGENIAVVLAPVLVLFFFYKFTIGGNNIEYGMLTGSTIAKAIAIWSFLYFFRVKYFITGLLLGLATLFQLLVGLQLFLVFSAALLFFKPFKISNIGWIFLGWFPIAAWILFPFALTNLQHHQPANDFYYKILYDFRNPHHYVPLYFPIKDYLFHMAFIAIVIWLSRKISIPFRRKVVMLIGIIYFGCIAYTVLFYGGFKAIGQIQWFKTTIWAEMLGAILLSEFISRQFTVKTQNLTPRWINFILILLIVSSSFLLFFSDKVPFEKIQGKYQVGYYKHDDLAKLHFWISATTPKSAVFLIPPENESFSCEAKRSLVVCYKSIIHEPQYILPWYDRITKIYHVSVNDIRNDSTIKQIATYRYNTIQYINQDYPINFRIDNLKTCKYISHLGKIIHREGDWVVTEF